MTSEGKEEGCGGMRNESASSMGNKICLPLLVIIEDSATHVRLSEPLMPCMIRHCLHHSLLEFFDRWPANIPPPGFNSCLLDDSLLISSPLSISTTQDLQFYFKL